MLYIISFILAQPVFAQNYSPRKAAEESQISAAFAAKGDTSAARAHLFKLIHSPLGQTAQNYYELGDTYIADQEKPNHRLAKVYLLEAIRVNPEYGRAYRDLAWIASQDEKYVECIQLATKAVTCKMPDLSALKSRSRAYLATHNLKAALTDANNYLKHEKRLTYQDFDYKANLQIQMGKIDDAIKTYEEAASFRGDWAVFQIVRCLELEHKTSEAITRVSGLIKKNSQDDDAFRIRARLYFKSKNFSGAVADLTQAIKLMPTNSDYCERAKAYEALGQKALAQKDIDESKKSF